MSPNHNSKRINLRYFSSWLLMGSVAILNMAKIGQSQLQNDDRIYPFADLDHTYILSKYIGQLIKGFNTKSIHLYFDGDLSSNLVGNIAILADQCGVSLERLVRYNPSLPIEPVNDDYVKTFHINVLHDNQTEDINLSYLNTQRISSDKYNSHFVLVFDAALDSPDETETSSSWMIAIFERFWEHNLFNVLIVFWDTGRQMLRVFTFNPFGNGHYLIELSANASRYSDLFWDKAANLNKHTFRVSLFAEKVRAIFHPNGRMSGTDGYLTELMIEKMNATLVLLPPQDGFDIGEFLKNGSVTGSLAQILNGKVDISFNTRFLRLKQFYGKAQITFTNGRDDICFLVAKAGFASNIYNIFRSFSMTVWLMTVASLFIATASYSILYKMQPESRPLENTFFNFYSWTLAQPIMRLPDNWATKILIAFWVIYALLITSSYEGNLTSNLVLRPMLSDINTIKQLADSPNLEILTFGRYVNLLVQFMNQSTAYKGLQARIKSVSTAADLEQHIKAHELQYAYANKQHINQYLSSRKENIAVGRPVFHNVPECPVPFLVAYALRIGSPYLARINEILRRAQENGLISYWDKEAEQTIKGSSSNQVGGGPVPLTLDHMQSAFYILSLGLVFSLMFLAAELCYWKHNRYRRRLEFNN